MKMLRPAVRLPSRRSSAVCVRTLSSFITQAGAGLSPVETFQRAIAAGIIREDPHQTAALEHLERLHQELLTFEPPKPTPPPPPFGTSADSKKGGDGGGLWSSLTSVFGGGGESASKKADDGKLPELSDVPVGVYMYGGVGVGKSLLMDTFFDCAPIAPEKKRRVHFHEFMLEVHRRMHVLRQTQPELGDPVPTLAYDISSSTQLLCFDEFQVTDVADALVMRRLFHLLFSNGLVMVTTSNRPPIDLYKNGIQRESFVPFIGELEQRCCLHNLSSTSDYRMMVQA
mmetsp:Transcript_52444/g.154776  ORF Transcript_52444/g.154776 Transcript_52444/m.154776 type:complete len:285 (+) Transcript_52444:6-860(+)